MDKTSVGFFIVVGMIVILMGGGVYLSYSTVKTETFTVDDKERVCDNSQGECRYLIFTDNGVYENTDSLLHGKFNSSDVYNQLDSGVTYEAQTNMFRAPFLSMYPNILQIKEVK